MRRFGLLAGTVLLLAAPAASGAVITQHATTPTYKLTLHVGPTETMYTAAQVKATHPKDGEVMVGDSTGMGGMSMGGNRHLEVHVYSKATGKVVTGAAPTITLTDTSATSGMAMAEKVNAMAMQGIDQGVADLHYGDNVKLTGGHRYKVVVKVKGEKATFSFKA
jgi:hypothetical protein